MLGQSLISTGKQGELFDASQLPVGWDLLPEHQQRGNFTAERVARNQERYQAIVQALGEGMGVRQIAAAYRVSPHTIITIRERETSVIATEKQETSRKLGSLIKLSLERFQEGLVDGKIHPSQLPVAVGIFSDKKALLDGDPTMRIDHTHRQEAITPEDVTAWLHRLKSAAPPDGSAASDAAGVIDVASGPESDQITPALRPDTDSESVGPAVPAVDSCPPLPPATAPATGSEPPDGGRATAVPSSPAAPAPSRSSQDRRGEPKGVEGVETRPPREREMGSGGSGQP